MLFVLFFENSAIHFSYFYFIYYYKSINYPLNSN